MNCLALDCATQTGWAVISFDTGLILGSGTEKLPGKSQAERFYNFKLMFEYMSITWDIGFVCVERPHLRGWSASKLALGLYTSAECAHFARSGMEVKDVHTGTLKKWATGHGKASKGDMILEAMKRTDIIATDDNEADAILIALYAHEKWGGGDECTD